jgi:peptidoglycan/LPS O-acetylase OafA/YrhL
MQISIADPVISTQIFTFLLSAALLLSARKRAGGEFFSVETTQEMKGFAILAIVLSHIGYFLVNDHRFLFPLSILAGVGVDLFLFLSGYGLTASAWKRELKPLAFYRHRLFKLFTPFWMVLAALFLSDFFLLGRAYGAGYMARSFLGLFPHADLYQDVNSPLWYLTFILFFYLLFPWVFRKRYFPLSALLLYVLADKFVSVQPAYFASVLHLYELHLMAFPLGVLAAGLVAERGNKKAVLVVRGDTIEKKG